MQEGYVFNTVTECAVSVGGRTYNRLIAKGFRCDGERIFPVPCKEADTMHPVFDCAEILKIIFSHLPLKDVFNCRQVNRFFQSFASDHVIRMVLKDHSLEELQDSRKHDLIATTLLNADNILSVTAFLTLLIPRYRRRLAGRLQKKTKDVAYQKALIPFLGAHDIDCLPNQEDEELLVMYLANGLSPLTALQWIIRHGPSLATWDHVLTVCAYLLPMNLHFHLNAERDMKKERKALQVWYMKKWHEWLEY